MTQAEHDSPTIVWCWRLVVVCRKEVVQFRRNWILALFMVYAFTMMAYHNATAISQELKNAGLVVIDHDRSKASRELVYRFHEPQFQFVELLENSRDGVKRLDDGDASMVLDIPHNFDRDLLRGRPTRLQLQIDGADSMRAYLAANYAENIVRQFSADVGRKQFADQPLPIVENDERVWFSPNHEQTLFMAIQDLAQNIFLFSILLPASALAREKERGTVEQLLVSPLSPLQIMLGKVLPMVGIILLASVVTLFFIIEGALALNVRGSIGLFLGVTALFSGSAAGLGILIASVTRNMGQVGIVSITLMPILFMLSGSDTPPEMMPDTLLPIMYLSPLHHYLNAVFAILIKGADVSMVWDSILYVAILGGSVFAISLMRFRQSFR
ncbi:Inner membrane transport permease YhhJ [Stieleria neptunia]|uniref:Inner membrane transport permease YhhJ n=1 Tax=Stieleria neptunia TaxID=2527979 RepID=A0A518HND8_9BACT|nr:ABC transporter permease [Stieleria neptunia]QDV42340.1 Inner membrane transport permease YhhJ [Stieleria neptunia]